MPQFDANIYLIFFLSGLVEIPADIIPFVLLNKFGRRFNLSLHYILGGLLCMATAAVPLGVYTFEWPVVVLAMLGKYIAQVRGVPRVSSFVLRIFKIVFTICSLLSTGVLGYRLPLH